jgi:putative membrane protein
MPRLAFCDLVYDFIFIALLSFKLILKLLKRCDWDIWLSIPNMEPMGWVSVMMEIVDDYTENPFQHMANDIPVLSLCQTIGWEKPGCHLLIR